MPHPRTLAISPYKGLLHIQHLFAKALLNIRTQLTSYTFPNMRGPALPPPPTPTQAGDIAALRNQPRITQVFGDADTALRQGGIASRNRIRRLARPHPSTRHMALPLPARPISIVLQGPSPLPSPTVPVAKALLPPPSPLRELSPHFNPAPAIHDGLWSLLPLPPLPGLPVPSNRTSGWRLLHPRLRTPPPLCLGGLRRFLLPPDVHIQRNAPRTAPVPQAVPLPAHPQALPIHLGTPLSARLFSHSLTLPHPTHLKRLLTPRSVLNLLSPNNG